MSSAIRALNHHQLSVLPLLPLLYLMQKYYIEQIVQQSITQNGMSSLPPSPPPPVLLDGAVKQVNNVVSLSYLSLSNNTQVLLIQIKLPISVLVLVQEMLVVSPRLPI
jgi:hypothetical protein